MLSDMISFFKSPPNLEYFSTSMTRKWHECINIKISKKISAKYLNKNKSDVWLCCRCLHQQFPKHLGWCLLCVQFPDHYSQVNHTHPDQTVCPDDERLPLTLSLRKKISAGCNILLCHSLRCMHEKPSPVVSVKHLCEKHASTNPKQINSFSTPRWDVNNEAVT